MVILMLILMVKSSKYLSFCISRLWISQRWNTQEGPSKLADVWCVWWEIIIHEDHGWEYMLPNAIKWSYVSYVFVCVYMCLMYVCLLEVWLPNDCQMVSNMYLMAYVYSGPPNTKRLIWDPKMNIDPTLRQGFPVLQRELKRERDYINLVWL